MLGKNALAGKSLRPPPGAGTGTLCSSASKSLMTALKALELQSQSGGHTRKLPVAQEVAQHRTGGL